MNITKNKLIFFVTIIVLITGFVITTHRRSSSDQKITVGVILPLTGQYGFIGESVRRAMELSHQRLPALDRSRLRLVFEDDKYTSKDALSAYRKVTDLDGADIIVSLGSPTVEITKPEVNTIGQLMFILGDELSHDVDQVFELMPQGSGLFTSLAEIAATRYRSISVIYASDNNLFKTNADLFASAAPAGFKVDLMPIQSQSDIRTEVSRVIAGKNDAIALFVGLDVGVKVLNELKKYPSSLKPRLLCDANMALTITQYVEAVGEDHFAGCVAVVMSETKSPAFREMYTSTYGGDPQFGSDFGYDAVQIIARLSKSPQETWLDVLNDKFSHDGYSGLISFDETGTRAPLTEVREFRGGKFEEL